MWPPFIKELTPFDFSLRPEFPRFLKAAFANKDIWDQEEMFLPVRLIHLLGHIEEYLECPNLPEWYRIRGESPKEGCNYYWFDFDIVDASDTLTPCRCVFNIGHPDANDGKWGAVWDRLTGILLVNISSTGDGETTIELDSEELFFQYQPHDCWLPFTSEHIDKNSYWLFANTICKNKLQFEDLVRIAVEWCTTYIYEYDQFHQYPSSSEEVKLEHALRRMQVEILQGQWDSFVEPYAKQCKVSNADIFDAIGSIDFSHYKESLIKVFEQACSTAPPWAKTKVICFTYDFGTIESEIFTASNYTHLYDESNDQWAEGSDQSLKINAKFAPTSLSHQIKHDEASILYFIARITYLFQEVIRDRPTPGITICLYSSAQKNIHRLRLADI